MLRQFFRKTNGNTSVEFAMVAPVLIGLVVLIFEFCYIMYVQSSLDRAGTAAAEMIRKDHQRSVTAAQLRTKVCENLNLFYTCTPSNVVLQVVPAGTTLPPAGSNIYTRSTVKGVPDMIRIKIVWPLFLPLSAMVLSSDNAGNREMVTYIAAHPEPPVLPCGLSGGLVWCL